MINIIYQDPTASIAHRIDLAKLFFYIGIIGFILCLKFIELKEIYLFLITFTIIAYGISLYHNLNLLKINYETYLYYEMLFD
ncbi:hypothetical protein GCM10022397_15420 [Flavivirga jejuensis]